MKEWGSAAKRYGPISAPLERAAIASVNTTIYRSAALPGITGTTPAMDFS